MTLSASLAACRRCAASLTAPFVDSRISSFVRSWVVRDPIGRSGGRCEPAGGSMSPGGQRPPAGEVSPRSGPGARRRAHRPGPRRRAGWHRRAGAGPLRRRGAWGSSVAALEASARGRSPTSAFTPALQEGRRGGVVALPTQQGGRRPAHRRSRSSDSADRHAGRRPDRAGRQPLVGHVGVGSQSRPLSPPGWTSALE